jgi:hypothetical protein
MYIYTYSICTLSLTYPCSGPVDPRGRHAVAYVRGWARQCQCLAPTAEASQDCTPLAATEGECCFRGLAYAALPLTPHPVAANEERVFSACVPYYINRGMVINSRRWLANPSTHLPKNMVVFKIATLVM